RILRAVREWDGAAFAAIPDERIAVTRSTFPAPPPVFSPLMDDPVTGFTVAVGADGRWHVHLEYNLAAPAEPGVYLLELELFSTARGIEPSRPFWLVLAKQTDETVHQAAVAWTEYVPARQGCVADFNRDMAVNSSDISAFLTRWRMELGTSPDQADIHPDLVI